MNSPPIVWLYVYGRWCTTDASARSLHSVRGALPERHRPSGRIDRPSTCKATCGLVSPPCIYIYLALSSLSRFLSISFLSFSLSLSLFLSVETEPSPEMRSSKCPWPPPKIRPAPGMAELVRQAGDACRRFLYRILFLVSPTFSSPQISLSLSLFLSLSFSRSLSL